MAICKNIEVKYYKKEFANARCVSFYRIKERLEIVLRVGVWDLCDSPQKNIPLPKI